VGLIPYLRGFRQHIEIMRLGFPKIKGNITFAQKYFFNCAAMCRTVPNNKLADGAEDGFSGMLSPDVLLDCPQRKTAARKFSGRLFLSGRSFPI